MPAKELSEYIESILEKNPFLKKEYDKKKRTTSSSLPQDTPGPDQRLTAREDPREALLSQLRMLDLDDDELRIAEYLLYEMDDNGYITIDLDEAATDLGADAEDVDKVLEIIQGMEPPGIGARDARECLQLQLKRMGKEKSTEYEIVTSFIHELAVNDVEKMASSLNIAANEVKRAINAIKKLSPRPAGSILAEAATPVIPDLIASIKNKTVNIGINRSYLPNLKFYNPYEHDADIIKDPEVREFVKANEAAAKHLIDSLKRREETVCKVANHILSLQAESLKDKKHDMKSLTIQDVAKAVGLHPSTISRAVSNKYIQLEDRVMPLNKLLGGGLTKEDGTVISKTAVRNRIAEMVSKEDKERPLSDDAIKEALKDHGIAIERRTVAKYRDTLGILPKHLRRKVR